MELAASLVTKLATRFTPGGFICAIGNPLNDGEWTYTWENGRQLARMQNIDTDASFVYNENGLRVQKTVNGVVTDYTLHGKNIVHMTQGSNELHFFYDAQNKPAVVVYNGTPYSYVKNLQSDIVALLDSAGAVVVAYTYDAWGRLIATTGSTANTLGLVQPFRYRSYVFDHETGLFYITNRYYDMSKNRWLNSDARIADVGAELFGNNTLVYCWNNPICMADPSGNWPRWITAAVAVVAAVVAVVAQSAVAAQVSVITAGAYLVQSAHYDLRQAANTDLPKTRADAKDLKWLGPDTDPKGPAADCHQYTSPDNSNVKYVSPDRHREVIFDSKGNVVTDPRDVGTYNIIPSGNALESIGHFAVDILPWVIWGNSDEDPGPVFNTVVELFE